MNNPSLNPFSHENNICLQSPCAADGKDYNSFNLYVKRNMSYDEYMNYVNYARANFDCLYRYFVRIHMARTKSSTGNNQTNSDHTKENFLSPGVLNFLRINNLVEPGDDEDAGTNMKNIKNIKDKLKYVQSICKEIKTINAIQNKLKRKKAALGCVSKLHIDIENTMKSMDKTVRQKTSVMRNNKILSGDAKREILEMKNVKNVEEKQSISNVKTFYKPKLAVIILKETIAMTDLQHKPNDSKDLLNGDMVVEESIIEKNLWEQIPSKPIKEQNSYVEYEVSHFQQRFSWDCGIACMVMVMTSADKKHFITNFESICDEEGFKTRTWTIDLCYMLKRYGIHHSFHTITLGVFRGYRAQKFYGNAVTYDQYRVNSKFVAAIGDGLNIKCGSLSNVDLINHLKNNGPIILLVNGKLLTCDICKINKFNMELTTGKFQIIPGPSQDTPSIGDRCLSQPNGSVASEGLLALSNQYVGHYIIICGYNLRKNKFLYRNPTFKDRLCAVSFQQMLKARRSFGTDEDIILIYKKVFQ